MVSETSTRSTTSLRLVLETAEELGLDHEKCLANTGLVRSDLYQSDKMITLRQEVVAIQNIVELSPQKAGIGVEVGKKFHVNAFGIWGFAILTSETLRAAIETAIDFTQISFLIADMGLVTEGGYARVYFDLTHLPKITHYYVGERHCSVTMGFLRELTQKIDFNDFVIETMLDDTEYTEALEALLKVPVLHSQDRYSVGFPEELLDIPLPKSDPVTLKYCVDQCKAMLDNLDHHVKPWSQKVRDVVLEDISQEQKIENVADKLSVTERTLRRRLTEENTNFREVYTDTRLRIAYELLETTGLNVETASWRVGYSEPASFVRAFSKRFGHTPGEIRNA